MTFKFIWYVRWFDNFIAMIADSHGRRSIGGQGGRVPPQKKFGGTRIPMSLPIIIAMSPPIVLDDLHPPPFAKLFQRRPPQYLAWGGLYIKCPLQ